MRVTTFCDHFADAVSTGLRGLVSRYVFRTRPKKVLYEHIPKCAGTSVRSYLKSQYPFNRIYAVRGSHPARYIAHFESLPEQRRHRYDLIVGHGAHQLRRHVHPDILKATILRDPVDRVISHYFFVLRSPEHYLHHEVTTRGISLLDYATGRVSNELRNHYVSSFLEMSAEEVERSPDESVAHAFEVIRSEYDVVGTVDDLDAAIGALAAAAGFHDHFRPGKLNVTADRPTQQEIDPATIQTIADLNSLDVKLYELIRDVAVSSASA